MFMPWHIMYLVIGRKMIFSKGLERQLLQCKYLKELIGLH